MKLKPVFHLALEGDKHTVLDQKDALLLRRVAETHSLTQGAKLAGMSYRSAWDRIRAIESNLGIKIIDSRVGGVAGGASSLTAEGATLLRNFRRIRKYLFNVLDEEEYMVQAGFKLSARNRVKGEVSKVEKGPITASVKIEVTSPFTLTSIITREAVEDLDLKEGDVVEAIVKATEVVVAKQA